MTTELATREPIYISKMAPSGVDGRTWANVLKTQLLSSKGTEVTNEELLYFAQVCQSSGLDPTKREIYGIFRGGKLSIQTGIDGLRKIAEQSNKYAGSKEPEFVYSPNEKITVTDNGHSKTVPNTAKVTVLKLMGERVIETTRTANWMDYYPGEKLGQMWRKFPETMLSKVAEAQALRAAFPNCSQVYVEEEMQQAEVTPSGTDLASLADKIKATKTTAELMELLNGLSVENQKDVMALANSHAQELLSKEEA